MRHKLLSNTTELYAGPFDKDWSDEEDKADQDQGQEHENAVREDCMEDSNVNRFILIITVVALDFYDL